MKKNLSVILVLTIIFTMFSFGTLAKASDLDDCWAKDEVQSWINLGIINGYPDGTFRPDNNITRAEFMAITNKAFNYTEKADISFSDVPMDSWFAETVQRAISAGYITGYSDGTLRPDDMITRQEAATIIGRIKKLTGNGSAAEKFTDYDLLPEWCKAFVGTVAEAKIMRGYPDGSFRGSDFISRAEAVVALKQALDYKPGKIYDKAGVYGPEKGNETIDSDVYIKAGGIELRNLIIKGNLFIDDSAKEGNITLRNVKENGKTEVNGNKEINLYLTDSALNTLSILKSSGKVKVIASGTTMIEKAEILSGVILEESNLTGDGFKQVIIKEGTKGTVTLSGRFERVQVKSEEVVLDLPQSTTIAVLEVEAKAKITGQGTVQKAQINASGVIFDYSPQSINVAPGIANPTILHMVVSGYSGGGGWVQPVKQKVADPAASLIPGAYEGQQNVTLTCTTAEAEIWYTLDGTDPKVSATKLKYTSAINLSVSTTIKAYAIKTGMLDSEVQTFSYIINMESIAVAADKNALLPGFAAGDSQSSVTQNISLPIAGANGSLITWLIDKEAVISKTGVVTRANTDQTVTLTATITKGTASDTKTFTVIVKAAEQIGNYSRSYPVMAYDSINNRYMMVYFRNDKNIGDYNLYGRLVNANGSYFGEEFPIRTSVNVGDDYSFKADIAYDSVNKMFLVVWNEAGPPWDVYGQIMYTDGTRYEKPFAISDINDGKRQNEPYLTFDNVNNKFLVAYRRNIDENQVQDDIYGRFLKITGAGPAVEEEFLITGGLWYQYMHAISFNGLDKFMIPVSSYESNRLVTVNSVTKEVYNEYVFGSDALKPSLAFDNINQRFLAAWFSGNAIYGRFINQDGNSDGDTFKISDGMVTGYGNVAVDYAAGYFYVVWQNEKADGDIDIYAKKIDAVSKALSQQITVAAGEEKTIFPSVCGNSNGALVAWTVDNEPKVIGSGYLPAQDAPASFTSAPQVAAGITLPAPITVSFTASTPAKLYYAVVQEDAMGFETPPPTAEQLKILGTPIEKTYRDHYGIVGVPAAGFQMLSGQQPEQIVIPTTKGFNAMRTYTVYMVMETANGILSPVTGATFDTLADNNAPVFSQSGNKTGVYMELPRCLIISEKTLDYDENYDLYIWAVKEADAPQNPPTATDIKANGKVYEYLTSGVQHVFTYTGLDSATVYKVYMVAQEYSGDTERRYSAVITDIATTATAIQDKGPDKAISSDEYCYVFTDEGSIRNKYLLIQLNQQLSTSNSGTLAANIRIFDGTNEKTLAERGDTVTIINDIVRITFANPPSEDFMVYIKAGAIAGYGTNITNKYEISVSVKVPDITPPVFETEYPKVYQAGTSDKSIATEVCLNENAAVFWVLLPAGAAAPQNELNIIDRSILGLNYGSMSIDRYQPAVISITGLKPGTSYDLWITAVDSNYNYLVKYKITLTTTAS